jgi:hypothetical protein
MQRGAPHFMVVVGIDATNIYLLDPGRGQAVHGCGPECSGRAFTLTSFCPTWNAQGRPMVRVTPRPTTPICGDGRCDAGERPSTCPQDCQAQTCHGPSSEACGNCGMRTRTCDTDSGAWGSWSACNGQGVCTPGSTESCTGGASRTCSSTCTWGACTGGCTPNTSRQCSGNAVYNFDSCGNKGTLVQQCNSSQSCVSGSCQSTPQPGISVSPAVGSTTQAGLCNTASSRALYRATVESLDQTSGQATIRFAKCDGTAMSTSSSFWIVVGSDVFVQESRLCRDSTCTRDSGIWPAGARSLTRTVNIWPNRSAYESAPIGDRKFIYIITGGSDSPSSRTWYQYQALEFTRTTR